MKIGLLSYDFSVSLPELWPVAQRSTSPSFRDSVAFGAKIALDKAACIFRSVASTTPSPLEWLRIVREVAEANDLWAARGWIDHPQSYHRAPADPPRATLKRASSRRTNFQHLRFESGYEPHAGEPGRARWLDYTPNRVAHAWVFRHPGRPRPWLMCIHGYGLGLPFIDLDAFRVRRLYHELGLNVVLPVLPLHGPRRITWQSGEGFFRGDVLDTIHAEAQALWDARRVLAWIRAQEAESIGIYGLSLGGYNAALLAALEADLACVIAGIPASDFVRLAQLHTSSSALRFAAQAGLNWDDVRRLFRVISPLALAPLVPHERRYIFGGLADCIVPPEQVSALWEFWGRPCIAWYAGTHLSLPWESVVESFLTKALRATFAHLADADFAEQAAA